MELSLDRLTKHYGNKIAVDCVSATLRPGVYGCLLYTSDAADEL